MLRAIATTARRKIALEKDFLVAVPTRLAIKNSRFKVSVDLDIFDRRFVFILMESIIGNSERNTILQKYHFLNSTFVHFNKKITVFGI